MPNKKVALLILDGWGIGDGGPSDAIHAAQTPVMDMLMKTQPWASLRTSGLDVGLPDGQMGNSEVGHLNIGAGRVVYQELVKINRAVDDGSLAKNHILQDAFRYARENNKKLHFFGLVSDGCIHSSDRHLHHLLTLAEDAGVENYYVHAFTDGRDTDPKSGLGFIQKLLEKLTGTRGKLASVIGRYYAMDRDKRWERVKTAYDLLVHGVGESSKDIIETIRTRYEMGETDEFLKPICIPTVDAKIEAGDVVISFNYRTDRCREITEVLTQQDHSDLGMKQMPLYYVTMTRYDEKYRNVKVIFEQQDMANTLGEVLSRAGKTQLRIAETEKYPHVTFFFSGGREQAFEGESRIMIPSPKVATYDLMPEMSAPEIRDALIQNIREKQPDFVCLNFANPDMVGHTGVYRAIVSAVETVDACLGEVLEVLKEYHYSSVVIADHGNADFALNVDGTPNTAHTTNPVPVIIIDPTVKQIRNGKLADIAPTILQLMKLDIPDAMNGDILV